MINKQIWIYWNSGWNNAPEISKICLSSWYKFNPDFKIIELDDTNIRSYFNIDKDFNFANKHIDVVAKSDIIRLGLLKNNGGIWVDSTCLCTKPLSSWLDDTMINYNFFAYNKHINHVLISSWFLASNFGDYIVKKWYEAVVKYWEKHSKKHCYFWVHEIFANLYNADNVFKQIWDDNPKYSALIGLDGPHFFVPYPQKLFGKISEKTKNYIDNNNCAVFKLTRHFSINKTVIYNPESTINYLFKKYEVI